MFKMKKFYNEENDNKKGVSRKRLADIFRYRKDTCLGVILGMVAVIALSTITVFGATTAPSVDGTAVPETITTTTCTTTELSTTSLKSAKVLTTATTKTTTVKTTASSSLKMTTEVKTEANTTVAECNSGDYTEEYNDADIPTDDYAVACFAAVDVDTYEEDDTPVEEYIVYKPSTKYVHRSTCRWTDSSCYEIDSTEGIESRKCTECDPDIEIVEQYVEPVTTQPVTNTSGTTSLNYITETERIMLCNVVGGEYGSDWVSQYDKACVVAVVMNRYYDGGWQGYGRDNTIYNVITAPGQFASYYANSSYNSNVTDSCISAVEYYFENQSMFPHYTKFYGDGSKNYFS